MRTRASLRVAIALFSTLAVSTPALTALAGPAEIETRVDAAELVAGQPVTLNLRLRGSLIGAEPDLSPLESGFAIVDVGRSRRQSVVNGVYDVSSDWTITLLPKSTGTLEIPALPVASDWTEAQSIRVLAAADDATAPIGEPGVQPVAAFLRVLPERLDPYVQQRLMLRVRLYAGSDVLEGAISDPDIDGARVERVGEDRSFQETVSGRSYRGIERTYAVLPEVAGPLTVQPVVFQGLVREERAARSRRRFGGFGASLIDELFSGGGFADEAFDRASRRRILTRSEPVTLDVRARPETSRSDWWLPASAVSLEESWRPKAQSVRAGEALTRRVTLHALGAGADQLPELAIPQLDGVKQYAEAAQTSETEAGTVRIQEFTVIPTRPGRVELPPIAVAWWDTASDVRRVASLDARSIDVLPAVSGSAPAKPPVAAAEPEPAAAGDPLPAGTPVRSRPLLWAGGLLLLVLVAGASWLLRAYRSRSGVPTLRAAERSLRRACRRSDPAAAARALHQLMRVRDPAGAGVQGEQWARALGSNDLAREVARLNGVRYSTLQEEWEGTPLWTAYRSTRRRRANSAREARAGLPPLYPVTARAGRAQGTPVTEH